MEELWRPFLASPRPLMVAVGTPMFTKLGNSFFRDPSVNTWDAANQSAQLREVERALGGSAGTPAFPYTGVGEAIGAFDIERLAGLAAPLGSIAAPAPLLAPRT